MIPSDGDRGDRPTETVNRRQQHHHASVVSAPTPPHREHVPPGPRRATRPAARRRPARPTPLALPHPHLLSLQEISQREGPHRTRSRSAPHHTGKTPRTGLCRLLAMVSPLPPFPPPRLTHTVAEHAKYAVTAQSLPAITAPVVRSQPTPASTTPPQSAEVQTRLPAHASAWHARLARRVMQTQSCLVVVVERDTIPPPRLRSLSSAHSPHLPTPSLLPDNLLSSSTHNWPICPPFTPLWHLPHHPCVQVLLSLAQD